MTQLRPIQGPLKLVTVNTAPGRAQVLVARVVDALRDKYCIRHVSNCEAINEVQSTIAKEQPDVVFCASMWTDDEVGKIRSIAEDAKPGVMFYALPHGLQIERGPDAVVEHLVENVPKLLDQMPWTSWVYGCLETHVICTERTPK